jgi:hypothetical protein
VTRARSRWLRTAGLGLLLAAGSAACGSIRGGAAPATVLPAPPPGLAIGWTEAECFVPADATADRDFDSVTDRCEHDLAAAFAPLLRVDERECGWDGSVAPARLGGEYLYAAQRPPSGEGVRIAYLPAYYRDCGWRLPACRLTGWLCESHAGDSEMIAVDLAFDARTGRWTTRRVFLSAHCHGRSDGRCRWYEGRDLERFSWADGVPRGAPVVWVAHGKHAGYPTAAECDTGHWGYDGCRGNRAAYRFPVASPRQNAGSRARPFPHGSGDECIGVEEAGWGSDAAGGAARECIWDPAARFRGWQGGVAGATGYGRYLREVAEF